MKISLQIHNGNTWKTSKPEFHEVKDNNEATNMAFDLSAKNGKCTVRLAYIPVYYNQLEGKTEAEKVCRLQGNYLQAR